ncbi:hypothetical protein GUJ93_ZPchr0010g9091 [Zizania palustris]|uniref:Retrotransposon gag domain-containing protein n=1 Tax=Zizania palustris TaxID=103762 RepID=A0A8J5WBI6_ZIZPA|nr:hypothetical protein GUJ93_ZPchr0010g9091 [Zizania palustris]
MVQCNPVEKVLYASHQLQGHVTNWWENFRASHANVANIEWAEFAEAFKASYIPYNLLELKREEFDRLHQGGSSLTEYLNRFTRLSRYASDEVDTDKKETRRFLKGIDTNLRVQLVGLDFPDFQTLVNKAILIESARKEADDFHKRKNFQQSNSSRGISRPHLSKSSQTQNTTFHRPRPRNFTHPTGQPTYLPPTPHYLQNPPPRPTHINPG